MRFYQLDSLNKFQQNLMKEEISPQNDLIADIYQRMLNGDNNALYKLQNINLKHPPRLVQRGSQQRNKTNTQEKQRHQWNQPQNSKDLNQKFDYNSSQKPESKMQQSQMKQSNFISNMNKLKQEMYLNVLKKGPKLSNILKNQNKLHHLRQKRWLNSSGNNYEIPAQEKASKQSLNKHKEALSQFSTQVQPNKSSFINNQKANKIQALPKVPKPNELPKVQSTNIDAKKITVAEIEAPKVMKKKQKTEKIDFKEKIGMNKKQKQQLEKMNQEQLNIQLEIVQIHKQTKQKLQKARERYELNFNNKQKYLKRKKKSADHSQQLKKSESLEKLSPFKLKYESERAKCQEITGQINSLKIQFISNIGILAKFQAAASANVLAKYLQRHPGQIYQEEEGEDEDTVQPLLTTQEKKDKYTKLMAHTRDKKWGLMQRTQYQAQRAEQLYQSRKTRISSRVQIGEEDKFHYQTSKQNKVTVNERLKMLLFN